MTHLYFPCEKYKFLCSLFCCCCLFFYLLIFISFFFSFIFISWRLITLQYCNGFCHTLTWTCHGFTCVPHPEPPSHLPPLPAKYMQTTAQSSFRAVDMIFVSNPRPNYTYGTLMEWTILKHMGTLQILHMDYPFFPFPQFYSFNGTILNHSVQSTLTLRTFWGQVRLSQTRKSGLESANPLTHWLAPRLWGFSEAAMWNQDSPRISFIGGMTVSSLAESVSGNVQLECATWLRPKARGGASESLETLVLGVPAAFLLFWRRVGGLRSV